MAPLLQGTLLVILAAQLWAGTQADWVELGGRCYLLMSEQVDHDQAAALCRKEGGGLVSVNSAQELSALGSYLNHQRGIPTSKQWWTSGEFTSTSRWYWMDGSSGGRGSRMKYFPWLSLDNSLCHDCHRPQEPYSTYSSIVLEKYGNAVAIGNVSPDVTDPSPLCERAC